MTLAISVLGGLDILCGPKDHRVSPKIPQKAKALVAYLALQRGAAVSREYLADIFWPYQQSEDARHSLRNCLFELRKAIGPDSLCATSTHCRLQSFTLDAADLDEAVANREPDRVSELYRGPLLAGLHVDSDPWREWLTSERDRLHAMTITALHALVEGRLAAGNHAGAIATADQLLRLDPGYEAAYRQIIRAQQAHGHHSEAAKTYRRCAEVLRRELDVEPDPETMALMPAGTDLDMRPPPPRFPSNKPQTEYRRGYKDGKLRGYELAIAHLTKQHAAAVARRRGPNKDAPEPTITDAREVAEAA